MQECSALEFWKFGNTWQFGNLMKFDYLEIWKFGIGIVPNLECEPRVFHKQINSVTYRQVCGGQRTREGTARKRLFL